MDAPGGSAHLALAAPVIGEVRRVAERSKADTGDEGLFPRGLTESLNCWEDAEQTPSIRLTIRVWKCGKMPHHFSRSPSNRADAMGAGDSRVYAGDG